MIEQTRISSEKLTEFAVCLLEAADVGADEAKITAECLVESNLRGHDSHGVVQIAGYVDQLNSGELVAEAPLEVVSETDSLIVADARFGFGPVQCTRLIDHLIPKARRQGIACGSMRDSGHLGRLGAWVERVAENGLAGLITVNDNGVLRCVAPPGGVEPCLSTNPLAIAVPTGTDVLALDISTSVVANGKVQMAHLAGKPCPPGWLQDAEGSPTTDPSVRFSEPRGTLLPMGGEQGYKGFGLGLLLDIFAAGLSGGLCPPADEDAKMTNNVMLVIWDPQRFAGKSHFLNQADKLIDFLRTSARKPGVEAIRLPGDRAAALFAKRSDEGIPLDAATRKSLIELAQRLAVDVPEQIRENRN